MSLKLESVKLGEEFYHEELVFDHAVAQKFRFQRTVIKWEDQVHSIYKRLEALREQRLETLLKEKGLAICSHKDHQHTWGEADPEKLGIFPRGQMRFHYCSEYRWSGSEYTEAYGRETNLSLLCPIHFPKEPNKVSPPERDCKGINIHSEVIEKDGKKITIINDIDVTDLPVKQYISEGIYRYFDIRSLPNLPE